MVAPSFFLETTVIAGWPMWMFRKDEQRLFREGEEIPHGWMDRPSPFNVPDPTVFDQDGDHSFGGPVKRKPGRPRKVQP